jgi:hypothetical protein
MRRTHTRAKLAEAVSKCASFAQVVRYLGLREAGGNHSHIKRRIEEEGIDTSTLFVPHIFSKEA